MSGLKKVENPKTRRMPYTLYTAILCAAAVCVFVLVCLIADEIQERTGMLELSDTQLLTLSSGTQALLEGLEEDVWFLPIFKTGTQSDLRTLLGQTLGRFAKESAHVLVEEIDPDMQPQRVSALTGALEQVSEGTVFVRSGTRIVRLEPEDFMESRKLSGEIYTMYCGEARFAGAIERVCAKEAMRAVFITGHGEADLTACSQLAMQLNTMGLEVMQGTLSDTALRAGDVLLLVGPQSDLTGTQAQTLKRFLDDGGHLVLACGADTPFERLKQLLALCDVYGLGFEEGRVSEDVARSAFYIDRPEFLCPTLFEENGVLSELPGRVIVPGACALAPAQRRPGVSVQPLLHTSNQALRKQAGNDNLYAFEPGDTSGEMLIAQLAMAGEARILQLSSVQMLLDASNVTGASVLDASENLAFVRACVSAMTGGDDIALQGAQVKRLPAQLIEFDSQAQKSFVSAVILLAIPLMTLLLMGVVLLRRRRL